MAESTSDKPARVGLFVTCLVDFFRPSVGFAAIRLLEGAGCLVEAPPTQTCCGQPAYNSGDRQNAKDIARQVIETFLPYDYVVAPSGSCAGMLRKHYPMLFADDLDLGPRAKALAAKTYELVSFLTDVLNVAAVHAEFHGKVTYHDSCWLALSAGEGASSQIFWWRRWSEQSRSPIWSAWPRPSPST
jgi:L-lactate dehydrogenase complex protein LldE